MITEVESVASSADVVRELMLPSPLVEDADRYHPLYYRMTIGL